MAHDGSQLLHEAASSPQGLVGEQLVSVGAAVNAPQQNGRRPLQPGKDKEPPRETLLMAGAEAIVSKEKSQKGEGRLV